MWKSKHFGSLVMLIGVFLNLIYFGYEYQYYTGSTFLAHFRERLLEHIVIIMLIPIFAIIGYIINREYSLREEVKGYHTKLRDIKDTKRYIETIINSLGEGILVIDENFTIVHANKKAAEITGLDLGELIGSKCYKVLHGENSPCSEEQCSVRDIFNKSDRVQGVHRHFRHGKAILVEFVTSPFIDETGKVRYCVMVFKDVTKRIESQKELEKLKDFNEKLLLASPIGIGVFDRDGDIVFANSKLAEICGAKNKEDMEKCSVYDAESLVNASFTEKIFKVFETGEKMFLESFSMKTPHNKEIIVDCHILPLKSESSVENILLIINDVTDKVNTLKKLEESNTVFRETLEELDSAYRELTLLRKIDEALNSTIEIEEVLRIISRGIVEVLGYDACAIHLLADDGKYLINKDYVIDESIVKTLENLTAMKVKNYRIPVYDGSLFHRVITEKKPILTNNIEEAVKSHTLNKKIWRLSKVIARLSGVKSGIGVPLIADNRVLGVLGVASKKILTEKDVDRLYKYANQTSLAILQAKMYEELQRTKEKIEISYHELKEIDRIKSDIVNNVTHELKTPLTIATLAMEQSMVEKDAKERKLLLKMAFRALGRQETIINNLMEFAKNDKEKYILIIKKVNLADIIKKAIKSKEEEIRANEINIKTKIKDIYIEADPARLGTAVLNILDNAIKFNKKGGEIKIKTNKIDDNVEILISDKGIGIESYKQKEIFEPLTQLDARASRRFSGTGMGLAVAKEIVEMHGGKIMVKSEKDKGSKFTILLPVSQKY
ncbi:MAG TPA: PAS domain S-box protein [Euryarchaeota archaeon]|nr:alkaline phosphatase synthesis sensor protein PhoR [archaeon BMS3Bbin15]HDL15819.1 PAS domain S-box protein [Euryarchaeota archaeon]